MTDKRCLIYETMGKVSDLEIVESKGSNGMRLHGIFGVCGIKNQNNRVYDKENYKQMVESLQKTIKESGCPGELEHPNSMNINLQNVSHKIESIQMNEDGTITGDILLLNTPSGKIAQAIVEGGLPLYISSRGAGTITNEGRVTLSTIKTYDLVGTPGFSQAKLTLKENQTLECLNEGLDDSNQIWAIVEGEDLLSDDEDKDKKSKEEKSEDNKSDDKSKEENSDDKEDKSKEEKSNEETSDNSSKEDDKDNKDNKNNGNKKIDMNELKEAIDGLSKKIESLEAQLHVAQESLNETKGSIQPVNYQAIEQWVNEEFAPEFKKGLVDDIETKINENNQSIKEELTQTVQNWITEEFSEQIQNWVVEEFAPEVQNWVVEEFAPEVQNWVVEEFSPEVQNWVVEEFAPEVQNWVVEEFSPEIQGWITEEFAPVVEGWITEEFAPEQSQTIETKVNENVSAFMESQKAGRLEEIDGLLESISSDENADVNKIVKENQAENKYKGIYVVESMPEQYRPSWELLTEARQQEIIRSSRMYDFMKEGQLEKFWANIDFSKTNPTIVTESQVNPMNNYQMSVIAKMKNLRNIQAI